MTGEQNKIRPEGTLEDESLYTPGFARGRARKSRRNSLLLGIGAMIYGSVVVHETVVAISSGKLVSLGGRRYGIDLPPFRNPQSLPNSGRAEIQNICKTIALADVTGQRSRVQ